MADDNGLLEKYLNQQDQKADSKDSNPEPVNLNPLQSSWGNPENINRDHNSIQSETQPNPGNLSFAQIQYKIKAVISAPKNRKFVIIGGLVIFLVFLAILSPVLVSLIPQKESEAEPEPTYIPIDRSRSDKTYEFDSQINTDFYQLESETNNLKIVDLELSFPQTEWEVEF